MWIEIQTWLEREIKFLVTWTVPSDARILRASLIRQTHLWSDTNLRELFAETKRRTHARIRYLLQNGVPVTTGYSMIEEIEEAFLETISPNTPVWRKYNLRVRLEKSDGLYIPTLTCKKVLSNEDDEMREKMEYDIHIPKEVAFLLLWVREQVLKNTLPIAWITKRRYYFETPDGHHWCYDQFLGANYWLQTIEVELQNDRRYESPVPWIQRIPPSKLKRYSMKNLQKRTDRYFCL
jgi:CYTH domain-containing protein